MPQSREMTAVWRLYDEAAADFDRDRSRLTGEENYLREVDAARETGTPRLLDLGCGTGRPIAGWFIRHGWHVTGVDAAAAMIALCRERFPAARWIEHDMRTLSLSECFDAIVAWDSFFHLSADEQRAMFSVFQAHAGPRASLLFTAGPAEGVAIGSLYGRELYHASLDPAEYRALLAEHGFEVVRYRAEDPEAGGHTVWLARAAA